MLEQDKIDKIAGLLTSDRRIAAAYLLGSAVSGIMRQDSDVDVALLPRANVSFGTLERLELAAELECLVGRKVDIGVVNSGNLVYASEAILGGIRIVNVDRDYSEATEARLLGCYLLFREDRREVEKAYRAA